MTKKSYCTQSGLEKLKEEYLILQNKAKVLSKQLGIASEQGDRSENADYKAAKEAQSMLAIKIAHLKNAIANTVIIDESKIDTSSVRILSQVKIKNQDTDEVLFYKLVPPKEAGKQGALSTLSPVAKGLLGKKVGDVVEIDVPAGRLTFKILEVTFAF